MPPDWTAFLAANLPVYASLTPEERRRLEAATRILVDEKNWEGCGGLAMSDEIKVTIAGWAAILLLGIEHDYYGRVKSVLVYPTGYQVPETLQHGLLVGPEVRLGEAWYQGPVVLSWRDVRKARIAGYRSNVVLHEFAHQLDMADRVVDGTPPLENRQDYRDWSAVMTAEFEQLQDDAASGVDSVLDYYGATNEGEFFAVATETFFQSPLELAERRPALYELLRRYYRQDPAARALA